jgi:predicted Zn-dependent protease
MMSKISTPLAFLARASAVLLLCLHEPGSAQIISGRPQAQADPHYTNQTNHETGADGHGQSEERRAEEELQKGTALTRKGNFSEAIPHLLAAQGKVHNQYAASFNLALCYVGIDEYTQAIRILNDLHSEGHVSADVENLLAQAYVGNRQPKETLAALEKAALATPQSEKLYLLVADACMEHQEFSLGLKVVDIGLNHLAQSPRLYYERGMFLSQLDQFDRAKVDFGLANKLAQGTEIGYLSEAYEKLLAGEIEEAIRYAREGISKGSQNPLLLTVLGQALVRSGIVPGQPEFNEAQTALEKAVAERPSDPGSQIALGQIYLAAGRLEDAVTHLEKARKMRPSQPSIYASLAKAYQRRGEVQQAQEALATLETLNQAQAERIRSAPGDSKMSYGGGEVMREAESPHH